MHVVQLQHHSYVAVAVLCATLGCSSNQDRPLYSLAPIQEKTAGTAVLFSSVSVTVDTQRLDIALPSGQQFRADRTRATQTETGVSWSGTLRDGTKHGGTLQVVAHTHGMDAVFNVNGQSFELRAIDAKKGILREAALPASRLCAVTGTSTMSAGVSKQALPVPAETTALTASVIDVAVLYTADFLGNEAPVRNFIDTSVALANEAFANSNVPAQYRLVFKGPLTGPQPPAGGIVTFEGVQYEEREVLALQWMNTEPAEVAEIRNATGADMVVLMLPEPQAPVRPFVCGVANVPDREGTNFGSRAFSVQRNNCGLGDYTFAHELGHNYGMFHNSDEVAATPNPRHAFGAGATFSGTGGPGATLMNSDLCIGTASPEAICRRTPFFSSPDIRLGGVPIGDALRDNARVARIETPGYTNLRATAASAMPVVRITSIARGAVLPTQIVTLSGTAQDPETGDISSQIRWFSSQQGFLGTGQTLTVTLNPGPHFLVARATDASGVEGQFSVPATVSATQVAPRAGSWYNPARSGQGIDFFRTADGQWLLFWFTYREDGSPTWYVSGIGGIAGNSWSAPLYRSTWNGTSNVATLVGVVGLTFSSAEQAQFAWTLFDVPGGEPMVFLGGGEGRTGAWYEPALSGWGVQIEESANLQWATVAFYEGSEPRWVLGSTSPTGPTTSLPLNWYTGPGLCPGCQYVGPPTAQAVGTLTLSIFGSSDLSGSATTFITAPSGATWNRPAANLFKLTQ